MRNSKYKWILYLISIVVVCTIAIQAYWNYKNYLQNKQNFSNQVQESFDNAIDVYYANLAKSHQSNNFNKINLKESYFFKFHDSVDGKIKSELKAEFKSNPTRFVTSKDSFKRFGYYNIGKESSVTEKTASYFLNSKDIESITALKGITSIYFSIRNDTLNFEKLSALIKSELQRKDLDIPFGINRYRNNRLEGHFNIENNGKGYLKTNSKSTFLKSNESLELLYPNASKIILKQGAFGILLSFVLSLAIIFSLFYMLKTIRNQKQLADLKNDLISNITHEFKTPIATIGVALEGIKNFNITNDKDKNERYLSISNSQLSKLNIMVEKLLETATLDNESLELKIENCNLNSLLLSVIEKHRMQNNNKTILFEPFLESISIHIDVFHFENAVNNIIDNAIKYGGNLIEVKVQILKKVIHVLISDNGNKLNELHKDKIFEKFYRVPMGNKHNVKGYGIGLYYTKKIIEKHKGSVLLDLKNRRTTFIISLPNE